MRKIMKKSEKSEKSEKIDLNLSETGSPYT